MIIKFLLIGRHYLQFIMSIGILIQLKDLNGMKSGMSGCQSLYDSLGVKKKKHHTADRRAQTALQNSL